MEITEAIRSFEGQPITRQILLHILKDYKYPQDKITDLVRDGILTKVKSKVYIPGPGLKMRPPEPFLLANQLASPSYISMETALSYWKLIPERVYEITSAISGRSRVYTTPAGRFRYIHLPISYFSFGQRMAELGTAQVALIATAEKALCDTVISTSGLLFRSNRAAKEWLLEDMRMEGALLKSLDTRMMKDWLYEAPKNESLQRLIEVLEAL